MMRNKLYIIDGNNLAHRAYHKFRSMNSSDGTKSSITFGFTYILKSLIASHKPDEVIVVFDGGRSKRRLELLPTYKEKEINPEFDYEDFIKQKEDTIKILGYLGIPVVTRKGTEADDVIWLLARRAKKDKTVVIVSSDKDFNQLLSNRVSIWNPYKNDRITHKNVEKIFGYTPEKCVDYLVLDGDKSDKIPGYHGVGKVTAMKFLEEYGSISKYLKNNEKEHSKIKRRELEELWLTTREIIDIRLFCRRNLKQKDFKVPKKPKQINKRELAMICSKYSINIFLQKDFQITFKNLL